MPVEYAPAEVANKKNNDLAFSFLNKYIFIYTYTISDIIVHLRLDIRTNNIHDRYINEIIRIYLRRIRKQSIKLFL